MLQKLFAGLMTALLLAGLLTTELMAHDSDIDTPDGLTAPAAPVLPAATGNQTRYRIDPNQSEARYSVQEVYVGGIEGKLVVGQTNVIDGEVLVDWDNPSQSQLGMVTVNVEQLTSDSRQRDRQIRSSYLESSRYPEATYIPEETQTFPDSISEGETVNFVLHGFLTVHDVTILSDWAIELTVERDRLVGSATTDILMSDFGVGPISIVGLLSTEDKMQLTLDFIALSDGTSAATERTATVAAPAVVSSDLTFSDVRPIFEEKCVTCHIEGEIGHSIYPMDTVGDVIEYADDIALMIQTGFMPPWPPSEHTPAFKDDRSLSDMQQAQLLEWIAAGAPNDVDSAEMLTDRAPSGTPLRQDIVLTMPEPYVPTGDLYDDYRCFLLDPQLPNGGFVTGSNILPGEKRVVHHVILFQAPAEARAEVEELAAQDEGLGYECFGGTGLSSSEPGSIGNSLGGWVPGTSATFYSPGTGMYVPPDGLVIMQVHYNYESGFLPDQTSAMLQVEPADANLIALQGIPLLAPVEIPCPSGSSNQNCDRDLSLDTKHPQDQRIAQMLLNICGQSAGDFPQTSDALATTSCDWRVPVDGELVSIGGHMHTRGAAMRVTLNPDSDDPTVVQDIPIWDFNWQGAYQLVSPLPLKQGDILRISCTWDNITHTTQDDAYYMTWGEGTNDEMCLNIATIKPAQGNDDLQGLALFLQSLSIYPDWLPTPLRAVHQLIVMQSGVVQVAIWGGFVALLGAAVLLCITLFRRTKPLAASRNLAGTLFR